MKHLGTLARLELREQTTTSDDGAVGVIWDLKKHGTAKTAEVSDTDGVLAEGAEKLTDAIDFFIIGFANKKGKLGYYVSKFYNVTDVNGDNFGAGSNSVSNDADGLSATSATEQVIVSGTTSGKAKANSDYYASLGNADISSDGTIYVWVDIYPANTKYGLKNSTDGNTTGEFIVDIYLGADTPTASSTPADTVRITQTQTGYTDTIKQAKPARYGMALASKKMTGYVNYQKTYAADEVVEE